MVRKIIHLDLDAFYCAVEELSDPSLRGIPFAVGGRPEGRGVVTSASYAARRYGVKSAMPMAKAVRVCPDLRIVSSDFSSYRAKSKEVMQILRDATPLVEQISIDEAFLDISEFKESSESVARQLQSKIRTEVKLPCSLGAATNKLMAKIATNVGKAAQETDSYPNAIQIVPPGEEAVFLAPLPVEALWGVGPKTAARFYQRGINTIGDIAILPTSELKSRFGKIGEAIGRRSKGLDNRPVTSFHEAKSISHESTFFRDVKDEKKLFEKLKSHSGSISRRLKKSNLMGTTVKLKLRWPDFTTFTRQVTLASPTDDPKIIFESAKKLLGKHRKRGKAVRLIGVGITNLQPPIKQLSLWDAPELERNNRLDMAVEELKRRYGDNAISRGKNFEKDANRFIK